MTKEYNNKHHIKDTKVKWENIAYMVVWTRLKEQAHIVRNWLCLLACVVMPFSQPCSKKEIYVAKNMTPN